MKALQIKQMTLGEGKPQICIPMTGRNREEICRELEYIQACAPDLAEWRVDCYDFWEDRENLLEMMKTISDKLEEIPLLFTFRTRGEGGSGEIMFRDYVNLLLWAAETGLPDLVDVEVFFCEQESEGLIQRLHSRKALVIASNHHFDRTPGKEELLERMGKMEAYGADVLKMAVMPEHQADLWTLLCATTEISAKTQKPVVTMSMGKTGVLSRVLGEAAGSCMTFAAGIRTSAPGQIDAGEMKAVLETVHRLCAEEN